MQLHHLPNRITAGVLAAVLGFAGCTSCSSGKDTENTLSSETMVSEQTESVSESVTEPETEAPTEHISPRETVVSTLGTQVDVNTVLTREEGSNAYHAKLSDFVQDGDVIQSFTFVFYAEDGVSDIGTYKGGFGISVSEDCSAATDKCWYQSEDVSVITGGAYAEIQWDVPASIRNDIDANGEVLVGYWWGDTERVRLSEIICSYTRTAELPVDGTETLSVGQSLNFNNESAKSVNISLADILKEGRTPQAITFDIQAGGSFGKFTGAFGITTSSWYQSETIAVPTDASSLSLTWILPESVKPNVPEDAEVMLGYWWGDVSDITLQSITVRYSIGGASVGTPAKPDQKEGGTSMQSGNAAAIAEEMKIGWCLGNTLDCYDVTWKVDDFETAWGNVRTTKEMIAAVQAKGFGAVRIPVAWTDHMSADGTVDADWMARVKEVVDYAMDCGLYTIVNVHHDDYTWLHPTYAEEAAVTAKYTYLWEQIAAEFRDYDAHLLFEGLNEPRIVGSPAEWTGGTQEEYDVINRLLQTFVDTVRASGGRNAERTLIVTTQAASITNNAVNGLVVPDDGNLIVSIHNYAPWKFTTLEYPEETAFTDAGRAELDKQFDFLYDTFVSKGIPVIIGEFGAENKGNPADRAAYYAYYIQAARERGITCFVWDNGPEDSYGLLNRKTCTWFDDSIVDGMISAVQ